MTEEVKPKEGGELSFDKEGQPVQPTPQGETQKEFEAPESLPFQIPEKFTGKTVEDVAKSYVEVEKQLGKSNERYDKLNRELNQLKSAILASQQQGQMRTQGIDRQPLPTQTPTSLPEDKGFLDNLLGDQGERYFDTRVFNALSKYSQALQYQQSQQLEQSRQAVSQTADSIMRQLAEDSGTDYKTVERMVNDEFLKDEELVTRFYNSPHTASYEEIDKHVRALYKKGKETDSKTFESKLKDIGGIDRETLKQLAESRKQAAASATPGATGTTQGDSYKAPEEGNFSKWLAGKL